MDNNKDNEELEKDLKEQYAMLENEVQEDKKKKRFIIILVSFLTLFLIMFGTTFSYFKIFKGSEEPKNEYNIKDLYIEGYRPEFEFSEDVYNYVVRVDAGTTRVDINYSLNCTGCRLIIEGNENLKPGENIIRITFIDPDGNEKEYIIFVLVGQTEDNGDLGLKSLAVSNHELDKDFYTNKTDYIVHNISKNESIVNVEFELLDNTTLYGLKLNGSTITRSITKKGNINNIYFNVQTELMPGANKLEIITRDTNGNTKTYVVYLVVEDMVIDVVQIGVEYFGNTRGRQFLSEISPGWVSDSRQHVRIINTSNYNVLVKIEWTQVKNEFTNKQDLVYRLYKNDNLLKEQEMPSEDEVIISEVPIKANSINDYYLEYEYKYKAPTEGYTIGDPTDPNNQNVDQGKTFTGVLNVALQR